MGIVSYQGLDEAELVHGLYHGTHALGMGKLNDRPGLSIDDLTGKLAPDSNGRIYIDYLAGRPLKVDIDTTAKTVTTHLYDRDAGHGACAAVVGRLLARKAT